MRLHISNPIIYYRRKKKLKTECKSVGKTLMLNHVNHQLIICEWFSHLPSVIPLQFRQRPLGAFQNGPKTRRISRCLVQLSALASRSDPFQFRLAEWVFSNTASGDPTNAEPRGRQRKDGLLPAMLTSYVPAC